MSQPMTFEGPKGQYRLRLANADDAPILAAHRGAMFRDMKEVDDQGASIIENASIDHLAALLEAREYIGFLVEHDGSVAGGGGVWLRPLLPRPGTLQGAVEGYVLNVYVDPDHRRGGVARAIMRAIEEWCRERGVARVVLHASAMGRALYEELGFVDSNEMRMSLR